MSSANIDSLVEYFGTQEDRHCGYCKSDDPSRFTHGMWTHKMTVQVYQDILDRGWRRSGKYCYKPNMQRTCCPQYTIRCDAMAFHPSKSQKRVVRRLNAFLSNGVMPNGAIYDVDVDKSKKVKTDQKEDASKMDPKISKDGNGQDSKKIPENCNITNLDPTDRRQRKAKFKRRQRKLEKLRAKGIVMDTLPSRPPPAPKPIENFLSFSASSNGGRLKVEGSAHVLEIRLVRSYPPSEEFTRTFQESVELYKKYQDVIHKDPSTDNGFRRFLVDSPLVPITEQSAQNEDHPGYGSFHQQYWLDGNKLIAVGVLDILPNCVSSKYLYYDPEYNPLSLGVYSALQEIALVRRLNLHYYYMGFYIHSCPKMRYKGRYRPSDLLCPETYTWQPIEKCQTKLDESSYSRFDETDAVDAGAVVDLHQVPVLYEGGLMIYPIYKLRKYGQRAETDREEVNEYAALVGNKASPFIILCR